MKRPILLCSAIVLLFALQIWINGHAEAQSGGTAQDLDPQHDALMAASGVVQSLLLIALYRTLRSPVRGAATAALVGAAIMTLLSFASVNTYPDPLAYIGYAKLPHFSDAYTPVPMHLHGGGFEAITARWGVRLPPLDYGPLWLAFDRITVGHTTDTTTALFIFRACNTLWLFGLFAVMFYLRTAIATLAVALMNPALYYYYIVQAHNDLFGILLIVTGMLVAQRRPLLGALIAGSAGLVKITLGLVALIACPSSADHSRRVAFLCIVVAVVIGGSLVLGGAPYMHSLANIWLAQTNTAVGAVRFARIAVHALLAAVALAATFAALFAVRFSPLETYAFGTLAPVTEPNYLGWCIPYALRMPNFAGLFFSSLPAITHVIDGWFPLYARSPYALQDWYCVLLLVSIATTFVLRGRQDKRPREG
jgi:hypothetical protein